MWPHAAAAQQAQGVFAQLKAWAADEKAGALTNIASLLRVEDIHLDLAVSGKKELLDLIGRRLETSRRLPHDFVTSGLQRREAVGSTALGQGVAIPHARVKDLKETVVSVPIPADQFSRNLPFVKANWLWLSMKPETNRHSNSALYRRSATLCRHKAPIAYCLDGGMIQRLLARTVRDLD